MTTCPSMHFLGYVKSKEELPEPTYGLIAFDQTLSVDGKTFWWIVENDEWVLREFVAFVCPNCGK